jgi:hypothetical protein
MELFLQQGFQMQAHCAGLVEQWGGGTVILSPLDLTKEEGLLPFAVRMRRVGATLLLDPQLYYPRDANQHLTRYSYWPQDYDTNILLGGPALTHVLTNLGTLNNNARTSKIIIPGLYCERVDEDWRYVHTRLNEEALNVFSGKQTLATLFLSGEAMRDEEQIESLLNTTEDWKVDGFYVIPEHPKGEYLVEDPVWLSNLLVLCSGLKLQGKGKEVIVGYSSHQLLCLAAANVDAIASGTFLKTRYIHTDKYRYQEDDEGGGGGRAKWYYCPQALSEFQPRFLDMAFEKPVLEELKSDPVLGSDYADVLFGTKTASNANFAEPQAFRHYLHCLHGQVALARQVTFRDTVNYQMQILDRAESLIKLFHKNGIRGQARDFEKIVDVNRAALTRLEAIRGFQLDRRW